MNALKIILGSAFFLGIMVFLIGMFVAPKYFTVNRTTTINAPAETVYPYVASLEAMDKWSPWSKIDPSMKNTFDGASGTVGSVNRWESENENVGVGSQTITKLEPNKAIHTRLDFISPYEGTNTASVKLKPNRDNTETKVSWNLRGDFTFVESIFMMFMDMEAKIGPEYEKGLASLKTIVEQENTIISSKDKMPATAN